MLRIAGRVLDPRLIVLDKDGTLISFDALWHAWFDAIMAELAARLPLDDATLDAIAGTIGFERATGVWDPQGPLTLASTKEIGLLLAGQIYRFERRTWDDALAVVREAEEAARAKLPLDDLIEPIGDVRGLLQRLVASGVLLGLATTDDRAPTERTLRRLGLDAFFATLVCGDDGIPIKPAPDMARTICERLHVAPQDAIAVGDTIADMTMAREAGLAYAVAVASGALQAHILAPHADLVIPDIHAIEVLA
ncbi:MAG: HAD family hydrolase [Anaerolineae bacterium]